MQVKSDLPRAGRLVLGAPAENRTPDTMIKSHVLYQLSYRGICLHHNILAYQAKFVNPFFKVSRGNVHRRSFDRLCTNRAGTRSDPVFCTDAERIFNAQEPVVLGDAFAAAGGAGLDIRRVCTDGKIGNRRILGFTGTVG